MKPSSQIVISASRRTDIPAFYMDGFMAQIRRGYFEVVNPYNRRVSIVRATPEKVHTIVFWSKNFGPFLEKGYGNVLLEMGFNLFFNFTINADSPLLEPNVPPLTVRMNQLATFRDHFDMKTVNWRFDPICFYQSGDGGITRTKDILGPFQVMARDVSRFGIKRCITSFMDDYPKIRKRVAPLTGFRFIDPPLEIKKETLIGMDKILNREKMELYTCCEKDLLAALPPHSGVRKSACIPNDLLVKLFGGNVSLKQDTGQRAKNGCGCMVSVDVGSYHRHPCYHNCLFCYANPSSEEWKNNGTRR